MAEYIKRGEVSKMLNSIGGCDADPKSWADGWDKAIDTAISEINEIPAADVRPERHGEWFGTVCSACGGSTSWYYDCDFCPNCGAKMDGKDV